MEMGDKNGKKHVWLLVCLTKAQNSNENLVCFLNNFVLTKLWNSNTLLPFVVEVSNHWHFKVVCQVH
jgi:hypothetical protein